MAKKPTRQNAPRIVRKSATKAKSPTPKAGNVTKQDQVLAMLRRPNGASVAEIVGATDWQPHSVRGFLSGALKRRLKIDVVSSKDEKSGERRYHVAALKA
jgi:hypothetical protein